MAEKCKDYVYSENHLSVEVGTGYYLDINILRA